MSHLHQVYRQTNRFDDCALCLTEDCQVKWSVEWRYIGDWEIETGKLRLSNDIWFMAWWWSCYCYISTCTCPLYQLYCKEVHLCPFLHLSSLLLLATTSPSMAFASAEKSFLTTTGCWRAEMRQVVAKLCHTNPATDIHLEEIRHVKSEACVKPTPAKAQGYQHSFVPFSKRCAMA